MYKTLWPVPDKESQHYEAEIKIIKCLVLQLYIKRKDVDNFSQWWIYTYLKVYIIIPLKISLSLSGTKCLKYYSTPGFVPKNLYRNHPQRY